jgi:pyridoxine/pyridoxamine 5'-phosphate oxidase
MKPIIAAIILNGCFGRRFMDQAGLYSFLKQYRYAVVSSASPGGTPQSALIGIAVTPALEIIFDTVKMSRKYPNLKAQPSCSLVIGWEGEQTV